MPLPMIHLAVAVEMSTANPRCTSPDFLLGSIAPDSIHKRPGSTRADKARTHCEPEGERFADESLVEALVLQYAASDFALGYAAHILTDNLWMKMVLDPWRTRVPTTPETQDERTLYYSETDQVDFNLYHHAPWRPTVWENLAAAEAIDFPPMLSAEEIDGWRVRTLHWFTELKEEPGTDLRYFTDEIAQRFIKDVSPQVAARLAQWEPAR